MVRSEHDWLSAGISISAAADGIVLQLLGAGKLLASVINQSSEIGDDRPISACQFSPDGATLLTGAWSGSARLWSMSDGAQEAVIPAHSERITGVAWHPEASSSGEIWPQLHRG